jgi:hypothetical protein
VSNATLSFLPWVRQGAASAIDVTDSQQQSPATSIEVNLTLNGVAVQTAGPNATDLTITLRGPAEVIGIDANQIVRTDPRPGTTDFESNCFPSIEFDRPDFPWLFTPAKADTDHRLRPWLYLIVVRKQPGVTLASTSAAPLPVLTIGTPAVPANELPDLRDSWAWAHAQVAANSSADDTADEKRQAVDVAFGGGPELTVSRLVCPRFLDAETDYIACVVPAFEVGRRAGIGQPVSPTDGPAIWNLAPAWSIVQNPPAQRVDLPVYYHWEFRTGEQGDFESLAKGLKVALPEGVGTRTIDISNPGFAPGGAAAVELEGALIPASAPSDDPIPAAFKANLASILNQPGQTAAAHDGSDPILAPPMYGRWHAGKAIVDPARTT